MTQRLAEVMLRYLFVGTLILILGIEEITRYNLCYYKIKATLFSSVEMDLCYGIKMQWSETEKAFIRARARKVIWLIVIMHVKEYLFLW